MKHIRNSTPYRLYVNGSLEGFLLNRGRGITGIILKVQKNFRFPHVATILDISTLLFRNNNDRNENLIACQ